MASSDSLTEVTTLGKQMRQFRYKNVLVVLPSLILQLASGLWPPKQVAPFLFPLQAALSGPLHCLIKTRGK